MNNPNQIGVQLMPITFIVLSVFLYYVGANLFAGFFVLLGLATYGILLRDDKEM